MKTLLGVFVLMLLIVSSRTNYIKDKPEYVEMSRPPSPNYNYIWLNDNWVYNRRNQSYTRHDGYWAKPKTNKNYKQGYWKTNKNGSHWVPGRWK